MLQQLLNVLFGCSHPRTTFPITPSKKHKTELQARGTYVVCLDCGKQFGYDWDEMKITAALN